MSLDTMTAVWRTETVISEGQARNPYLCTPKVSHRTSGQKVNREFRTPSPTRVLRITVRLNRRKRFELRPIPRMFAGSMSSED
jgi:hypothetical protein